MGAAVDANSGPDTGLRDASNARAAYSFGGAVRTDAGAGSGSLLPLSVALKFMLGLIQTPELECAGAGELVDDRAPLSLQLRETAGAEAGSSPSAGPGAGSGAGGRSSAFT